MPKWFSHSLRPHEKHKKYSRGIVSYSICVLLLAVFFPLPILAAGWAVLSLADGLAALVGVLAGKSRLPWNKNKTWIGSLTFLVTAILFSALAFLWAHGLDPGYELYSSPVSIKWTGLFWQKIHGGNSFSADIAIMLSETREYFMLYFAIAGIVSALVESLPAHKLDDNLSAPLVYSLALIALFLVALPIIFGHIISA
jgi:dolichol kinase